MAKGGSVIFNQFRHMKNLPLPESGYFKKLPPIYVTVSKFYPPPPPYTQDTTCLQLRNYVQHMFWPRADKPKSSARSFVIVREALSQESKFAALVLTCAQKSTVGKFVRSSLQGLKQFCCLRMAIYVRTTIL